MKAQMKAHMKAQHVNSEASGLHGRNGLVVRIGSRALGYMRLRVAGDKLAK